MRGKLGGQLGQREWAESNAVPVPETASCNAAAFSLQLLCICQVMAGISLHL